MTIALSISDPQHIDGDRPLSVSVDIADGALRRHVDRALASLGIAVVGTAARAGVLLSDTARSADVPVLVIGHRALIEAALLHGATGGLHLEFTARQLQAAIAAVAEGLFCLDFAPDVAPAIPIRTADHALSDDADSTAVPLTARETEVLSVMITGASNKAIARALDISVHTAKFHVAGVIAKLGASGRTDAVAKALHAGREMV